MNSISPHRALLQRSAVHVQLEICAGKLPLSQGPGSGASLTSARDILKSNSPDTKESIQWHGTLVRMDLPEELPKETGKDYGLPKA